MFLINVYHSCEPAGFTHTLSATLLSPIGHFNWPLRTLCQSRLNQPEPLHKLPSCNIPVSLAPPPPLNCCPAATSGFSHLLPSRNFDIMPHSRTHLSLRLVVPTPYLCYRTSGWPPTPFASFKRSAATAVPRTAAAICELGHFWRGYWEVTRAPAYEALSTTLSHPWLI